MSNKSLHVEMAFTLKQNSTLQLIASVAEILGY